MKCNQSCPGFELVSLCPLPMTITITPPTYIYIYSKSSTQAGCNTRSILSEVYQFELKVFILLDWLPYHGWRVQSDLLFTHCRRENSWIHTFPKVLAWYKIQTASSRVRSSCPFPMTVTSTPWTTPIHTYTHTHTYIYTCTYLCIHSHKYGGVLVV